VLSDEKQPAFHKAALTKLPNVTSLLDILIHTDPALQMARKLPLQMYELEYREHVNFTQSGERTLTFRVRHLHSGRTTQSSSTFEVLWEGTGRPESLDIHLTTYLPTYMKPSLS